MRRSFLFAVLGFYWVEHLFYFHMNRFDRKHYFVLNSTTYFPYLKPNRYRHRSSVFFSLSLNIHDCYPVPLFCSIHHLKLFMHGHQKNPLLSLGKNMPNDVELVADIKGFQHQKISNPSLLRFSYQASANHYNPCKAVFWFRHSATLGEDDWVYDRLERIF